MILVSLFMALETLMCAHFIEFLIKSVERVQQKVMPRRGKTGREIRHGKKKVKLH